MSVADAYYASAYFTVSPCALEQHAEETHPFLPCASYILLWANPLTKAERSKRDRDGEGSDLVVETGRLLDPVHFDKIN